MATTNTDATAQVTASVAITTPMTLCRWSLVRLLRKNAVEHRDSPTDTM